ncbi:MAG: SF3a splicing factor complex subunit [Sclerophora amabilis]|nr:MAG: SF3a splicing factor complex subunit [Sclerophora amabilis]
MAPAATDGDSVPTAALEEISKPPPGVVLPPKDIRAILEKTAGYVARNGAIFEDRIREKERSNPKFSFLTANDAYSAFYVWRLSEIKEGRGTAISAGRAGEVAAAAEAEEPKGPPEPEEFRFSARMPNINAQDLDVVRLTALFVAKNGRHFMTTLSQRETTNFQFDFLRPNHSLYQFFTRLVDQYTELLRAGGMDGDGGKLEKARTKELELNVEDRFHVLGRAKQRAEWAKFQEQQKQQKEEEEEKEKMAYAQVDWHDFVVVETVLFNEADEQAELPTPTSLSDLQSASLEQKAAMSLQPYNRRIEEAMPTDDDGSSYHNNNDDTQSRAMPRQQPSPAPPTLQPSSFAPPPSRSPQNFGHSPTPPTSTNTPDAEYAEEDEETLRIRERSEARARTAQAQAEAKGATGPMKIRSDYVPRAAAQAANRRGAQLALCPNCKQQIPLNELDEHMRIELLDPRWKAQRAISDARTSTSNLSTSDVAANLKRLASQRSDVFDGVTGQPISEEEAARRKRAALSSYDGVPLSEGGNASATASGIGTGIREAQQAANVEEQIRAIHQKWGGVGGSGAGAGGGGGGGGGGESNG